MSDLKLQGQGGLFNKEQSVQVRKLSPVVTADEIKAMTRDNNLDEMVVEDKLGERHVVYADELSVKDGKLPKVGETVNLPFLDEAVKVIHVDDEANEDQMLGGLGFGLGLTGLLAGRLLGGRPAGNDTEIKRLSGPAEVSEKELNWAESTQNKSLSGEAPSQADQSRFNDIMSRYAEQQKRDNAPFRPDSKLSQGDLNWALQLEKKVSKFNYQPNAEETERYTHIFKTLNDEYSKGQDLVLERNDPVVSNVPQSDIDWALVMEARVKDGYRPKPDEVSRYTQIARSLAGPPTEAKPAAPVESKPRKTD